jgi:hypothetical protein
MKFKNYFLIAGLSLAVMVSSCKKDEDETQDAVKAPSISMNGTTSGEIVTIPASAPAAATTDAQFSGALNNINQVGTFLQQLNNIPAGATVTNRSTNSATTYYWSTTDADMSYEVWYTVEEDGSNYNLTYEIAMSTAEMTIPRSTYMTGWVSQNGANGHLVLNFDVFFGGTDDYNYTYDWDTNAAGDFHVIAHWNVNSSDYGIADAVYEATVFATGAGQIDYNYTDSNSQSVIYHYDWNPNWTIVNWYWSINGDTQGSGVWNA